MKPPSLEKAPFPPAPPPAAQHPSQTIMSQPSYRSLARAKAVGIHCSPLFPITLQKAWGLDPAQLVLGKSLLTVSCHCQLLHVPRCGFQEVSFLGFTSGWWPAFLLLQPSQWVQRPGRHGWWGPALSMSAVTASPSPTGTLTGRLLHAKERVIHTPGNLSTAWPLLCWIAHTTWPSSCTVLHKFTGCRTNSL